MNVRLIAFLTASLTVHAGLLLWQPGKTPITLAIGGQAQALSITVINRVQAVIQQQVFAKPEPAKRASHPSKHAPTETPTPETSASRPRPSTRANAITTQRLNVSNSSNAVNVSKHISAALQNALASRFEYPWLARKRGWQGQVTLSLQVDGNGSLSHWQISTTSGHAVLDRSALKAAREIRHLPEAKSLLNGQLLNLLIPVHYQLIDS